MQDSPVRKKISIEDAAEGMILATDVFTDLGQILLAENTVLNDRSLMRLKLYRIKYIHIIEDTSKDSVFVSPPPASKAIATIPLKTPIHKETFEKFQNAYTKNSKDIESAIGDISSGKNVDMNQLFSMSNDLLNVFQQKSDLFTLLHNLRITDDFTYSHSINVSLISNLFGTWLGLSGESLKNITIAGLLHDIGKTQISTTILNKNAILSSEEFEEIKKHPIYGYRMLEKQNIPHEIKMAVLMHHEKCDGSGYPTNAKDNQIHEFAKIISIADIYDAMTSSRSYRDKFCPFTVIKVFEQESYGKIDTKFLLIFLSHIANYYLNSWVRLSSGEEGEVVFINQDNLSRPMIKIDNSLIDLRYEEDLWIEEII